MPPKTKPFPLLPRSGPLFRASQSCPGILAINWVMQGMRGMEAKELAFRIGLEALLLALLLRGLLGFGVSPPAASVLAFLGAHSLNFLVNGQFWVCARYCPSYRRSPEALDRYLERLIGRLERQALVAEALCIGSQGPGRGTRTERSDIDLRLVFPPGLKAWLLVNLALLALRTEALFRVIPLDLYAYDDVAALDRFDQSETLFVILDRQGRIGRRYAHRRLVTRA